MVPACVFGAVEAAYAAFVVNVADAALVVIVVDAALVANGADIEFAAGVVIVVSVVATEFAVGDAGVVIVVSVAAVAVVAASVARL